MILFYCFVLILIKDILSNSNYLQKQYSFLILYNFIFFAYFNINSNDILINYTIININKLYYARLNAYLGSFLSKLFYLYSIKVVVWLNNIEIERQKILNEA